MSRKMTLDQNAELDAIADRINKKYKRKVICRGEYVPNTFFLRRPSGIMQLDLDTGGGLPAGGWCLLSGPEGGGKSTLLYKYFAYQQLLHGNETRLALGVTEFLPDYFWLRACGMRVAVPDRVIEEKNRWRVERGLPHFTKDDIRELKTQVGRFDLVRGATGEECLETILDLFGTKVYQIIGLDSISAIQPEVDADKDLNERDARASTANLTTKFSKRFHPLTLGLDDDVNETTLIMISQARSNNKKAEAPSHIQKYLPDWAIPGAYAMRHGKLVDICIWPGAKVKEGSGENRVQTGKTLNWEIVKGKAGTHDGIRGEVDFDYKSQTDDPHTVFIAGVQSGVIAEGRSGFNVIQLDTGKTILQGFSRKGLIEKLATDLAFQFQVRIEILAAKGIQCRYH